MVTGSSKHKKADLQMVAGGIRGEPKVTSRNITGNMERQITVSKTMGELAGQYHKFICAAGRSAVAASGEKQRVVSRSQSGDSVCRIYAAHFT